MDTLFEAVLFYDDLSDERRAAVRKQLDAHPEMRDTLAHWMEVRAAVRRTLESDLPDRHLLVLYALDDARLAHTLTPEERTVLEDARPALEEALEAHPALHDVVEQIQEEQVAFEETWNEHVAPASEHAPARNDRAARSRAHRTEDRSWAYRLVGGFALLLIAVSVVFFLPETPTSTTIDVAEGEIRTLTLPDGSSARLAGVTRFTYPDEVADDDTPYVVSIQTGKAFFDVSLDANRTFIVETPTAQAEVIGTRFGIDTAPHHTDITLAEGALRIGALRAAEAETQRLEPGESTRVVRDQIPTPPESVDVNDALAWTGLFLFRQTPVQRIADQLGAAYNVSITVDDALANEPVTGTFERDQAIGDVLNAIAATLGASVEQPEADTYHIAATL